MSAVQYEKRRFLLLAWVKSIALLDPARESELLFFRRIPIWVHGYTATGDRREISSMYL